MKTFFLAVAMFATALAGSLPVESNVKAIKVAELPGYTEGVVVDRAGAIYVSDVYNGTIYRIAPGGSAKEWARTGAPNGHKIQADGTHLVCDGSRHAVLRLDGSGKILGKASDQCDGKPLRAPNDLTLDTHGGFYFTDPGGSNKENHLGTVHYVDGAGKTHLVADGLAFPNGIVLRPDGKTLLVGESHYNRILSYEVLAPGKLGEKRTFVELPLKGEGQIGNEPDGICLDENGNLFVAHYGMRQVQVVSPEGKILRRYPGGNLTTSNVAFAGARMDQLYVTGAIGDEKTTRGGVFRLELKGARGLKILPGK